MLTSLFFIFVKKLKMKKLLIYIIVFHFLFGCLKKIDPPLYDSDYGKGLYILSENNINYYDYFNNELKKIYFKL